MSSGKDQFGGANAKIETLTTKIVARTTLKMGAWGIDPAEIATGTPLVNAFSAKWAKSRQRKTSNSVDRENTKLAKKKMLKWIRPFVKRWVYTNDLMTDADILSCGLKPHPKKRKRVGKPGSKPMATYQVARGGAHAVDTFYKQQPGKDGVSRRGRPKGAGRAVVKYMIIAADTDITTLDPDTFPKTISKTSNPIRINFKPADRGKTAALAMCWETETCIRGDWCAVQTITIP